MKTKTPTQAFKKGSSSFFSKVPKEQDVSSSSKSSSDSYFVPSTSNTPDDCQKLVKKNVFDKNKWRVQKYSFKSKVEKWQNKRTQYFRHEYLKTQKSGNKAMKFDVQKIYEEEERRGKDDDQEETNFAEKGDFNERSPKRNHKRNTKLVNEEEREGAKEKLLKMKAEKEVAMERYRKKKLEKHKKLNKKTKKGQPIMKGRMELLLEKIQENLNS